MAEIVQQDNRGPITVQRRKLGPKHLKFIDLIASGFSQADAYRRVFQPHTKRSALSIAVSASHIAANPLIRERLAELRGQSQRSTLLSLDQRLSILAGIARSTVTKQTDRIRSIEVYTKIAGDSAPERQELTGKDGAPLVPAPTPVSVALSLDERIALLQAAKKASR